MLALLEYFGITRDSVLWLVGKIIGAAGLVATGVFDLKSLGITDVWQHRILVASGIILFLSGQYSTSSLPAKGADAKVKDPSRLSGTGTGVGAILLVVMTGLTFMALSGAALAGCYHEPPQIAADPAAHAAWNADMGIRRLQEFSNVIQADTGTQQGNISPKDAFTIIEWVSGDANHKDATGAVVPTTGLVQALQTGATSGWKAAGMQGWNSAIKPLMLRYQQLSGWVSIIDSLLQGLVP